MVEKDKPFFATIDRKELTKWLLNEAKSAGAKVMFGGRVSRIGRDFVLANDKEIGFKNLVGADGSSSIVRNHLGLPVKIGIAMQYKIPGKFEMTELVLDSDKFGPWYAWIAPHKDFTFVGAGAASDYCSSSELKKRLDEWCLKRGINIPSADFEGAPIQWDYRGYRFGNKYLVGDAAGFASAWTGEGIYFAMASGEDVAKTILDKNHNPILITKVLGIKRKHEFILSILRSNRYVNNIGFDAGFRLLKYNFFKNWLIDLVC